jgi:hypothetical protein
MLACNLVSINRGVAPTQTALQAQINGLLLTATALEASPQPTDSGFLPPTATPPAVETPALTATQTLAPAPATRVGERLDEQRQMAAGRILLFEDMSASRYVRLIKQALDEAGYFYVDVGSAQGWFKTQLLSDVDWDLVIAGAEADRQFGGEFYGLLRDRIQAGSSAVVETWDLDLAPDGQAAALLDVCGVQVQADWYLPETPVFFWTQPDNPLFNTPHRIDSLRNARSIWAATSGDLGDLLEVRPNAPVSGTAILASLNPRWNDHGLITSCLGGRVILQTFRSHEYQADDMTALWQNYVYNTLRARFAAHPAQAPRASVTYPVSDAPSEVLRPGPTPGPDYTFPHPCGQALTARVVTSPRYSSALFEHVPQGQFVNFLVDLVNTGPEAVQIWAGDYRLGYTANGQAGATPIHKAATGFLYIDYGSDLWQTALPPGGSARIALAFDIPRGAKDLVFSLTPGLAFDQAVCRVNIALDK